MDKANVLGVQVDNVTLDEAVGRAMDQVAAGRKGYVVTPNAEIVYLCRQDAHLRELVNRASLVLPDGIGVVYGAKILKQPLAGKVAGIDFADALAGALAQAGRTLYLLGSKPGVAEEAAQTLQKKYPGLRIAGCRDGYFQDEEEAVRSVNDAGGADVVFVCLGAPKQEEFMARQLEKMNATLLCGLGGSLDVFAGRVERAPDLWIRLGLEWLYRLLKEPRRIGRMMKLPRFLLCVLISRVKGGN